MILKERIAAELPLWRQRVKALIKESSSVKIDEVTVGNIYSGNRGVKTLVADISHIDHLEGIRLRGYTIAEVLERLPRSKGAEYPLAGGLYYLLLVGYLPTWDDAMMIENEWKKRCEIPGYVFDVLKALPPATHPMAMFSQAILSMQGESIFARRYEEGMQKMDYWEATLEDSLNLTAKTPSLAAYIYNLKYNDGEFISPDPELDWSANFAHMIGKDDDGDYKELTRLIFIIQSDHEIGNASAHTTHLVGSTLSDIYYACSAGMNALAGPLHGLANQGCLRWLLSVRDEFSGLPTKEELEQFAWDTLNAGKVIPGYGHAVLRTTDPRFTAQLEFGNKHIQDDEMFDLVKLVYEVIPGVLQELGKVKNPWPNVDAITGTLQYHYGVKELDIYTVLFGVSRILGLTSNAVWDRALGQPLERPKSLTTKMLEEMVSLSGV